MIIWISIENDGEKLYHAEWTDYVSAVAEQIDLYADKVNYLAHSIVADDSEHCHWQVEFNDNENGQQKMEGLTAKLGELSKVFKQEYVKWAEIDTEYLIDG